MGDGEVTLPGDIQAFGKVGAFALGSAGWVVRALGAAVGGRRALLDRGLQ